MAYNIRYFDNAMYIGYIQMERDRMVQEARIDDIREYEHEQGVLEGIEIGKLRAIEKGAALEHTRLLEEKRDNVKMLIQGIYKVDDIKWVDDCTEKELNKSFQYISNKISYEELKERMLE